jgi:hypothetical protein
VVNVGRDLARDCETELGWQALKGLDGRLCPRVRSVRQARNFQPVDPMEVVPIEPCPFCNDGGLRMFGYVPHNHMLVPVRQCDTCHTAEIGIQVFMGDLYMPPSGSAPV